MTNTNSPIQWTDVTWSPIVGCKRVSAGCDHCYAFELHDRRHLAWKRGRWPSAPAQYHQPFSKVQLLPHRLEDPLHWRKPRRVFVDSMADLFHESTPDEFIEQVFGVMAKTPQHTYQILTKRPERMLDWMKRRTNAHALRMLGEREYMQVWPLPNVWLGVSIEDQRAADERIPLLLQTPAVVRFLSCEPLLSELNIMPWLAYGPQQAATFTARYGCPQPLSWVIIGGESGPRARGMDVRWALTLRGQCQAAGVPVFVKQLGQVWAREHGCRERHAGDPAEWPVELRVREFPVTAAVEVAR